MKLSVCLLLIGVQILVAAEEPITWNDRVSEGTLLADQGEQPQTQTVVPRLVSFSGVVKDAIGKPLAGNISITFSLYSQQQGGSPLWSEMQTVQADSEGHYTVFLGAANGTGLPLEAFTSGAARWLAVRPDVPGMEEMSRVLLVGVPYALKAADADSLGGKPASAYMTSGSSNASAAQPFAAVSQEAGAVTSATPGGSGTANYIPIWVDSNTLGNSILYQAGNNIGIGTAAPGSPLSLSSTGNSFPTGISYLAQFTGSGMGNSAGTTNYRGLAFETTATGSNPFSGFTSITGDNFNSLSTGTLGTQSIFSANLRMNSNGSTTSGYGFQAIPILTGKGGITTWEAFDARTPSVGTGGGAIANSYALYLEPQKVTGVTTGYGVYQSGSSDVNYLAGKLGIGTSAPAANLEVNGTARFDGAVTLAGNVSTSGALISTVATGTAPLQVASTTQVANLNASYLGGQPASAFASLAGTNEFSATNYFPAGLSSTTGSKSIVGVARSNADYAAAIVGSASGSTALTIGVEGLTVSPIGTGVYGGAGSTSSTGMGNGGYSGVWADTSLTGGSSVTATADDGYAGLFVNNSLNYATLAVQAFGQGTIALFESDSGSCTIGNSGNLSCTGSKSAVVPVDNGTRKVALYAVESPENWFEDFGSGQLTNGQAIVRLEATFAQTVNAGISYHVFITPRGESKWLYVNNATAEAFEVHEAAGGQSNIEFDYRIVARRKGYEDVRLADKTKEFASANRSVHRK